MKQPIRPNMSYLNCFQKALHTLLDAALKQHQNQTTGGNEGRKAVLEKVTQRLAVNHVIQPEVGAENPLADLLPELALTTRTFPESLHALAEGVLGLADQLPWYHRPVANNPIFMKNHINAQIMGPEGLVVRDDLIVGVTLMRPNVDYPDHQHEPEELYLVLSQGLWRQENGPWGTPGLGGLVYNPSYVFHGMKSVDAPLFALWCLPLDKAFTSFSAPLPTA